MKYKFLIFLSVCFVFFTKAVTINVDSGRVAAKPVAVVPFAGNLEQDKIDYIVSSDLKQSGIFSPISPASYSARPKNEKEVDYNDFASTNAAYLVVGEKSEIEGKLVVRFALLDNIQHSVISTHTLQVELDQVRLVAHQISDIILAKLTGVRGAFASRIVYVHELDRSYQIIVSDSDGHNPKTLIKSPVPLMTPRFSPDGKKIVYVSFEGQQSQIIIQDIFTGQRQLVSKELGVNSAPAWSPDSRKIAFVLSKDGNSEVYFKDLTTSQLVRVTNNPRIDTEPTWSQSGKEIYFTSDRTGSPQLYRINVDTGALAKVTGVGSYSAGVSVSKDNQMIAFSRKNNNGFVIGRIDLESGQYKAVSKGPQDENPRFSPNGQMLIFTSVVNGKQVLKLISIDGLGENTLSTSGNIRDPDWSTYIN